METEGEALNIVIKYLVVLLLLIGFQAPVAAEQVDLGELKNSEFRNHYFGFTIQISDNWNLIDNNDFSKAYEKAKSGIEKNDGILKTEIEGNKKLINVLTLSKQPNGITECNPNFGIVAVNLNGVLGVTRGKQLFEGILAGTNYKVIKDSVEEKIGGIKFDTIEFQVDTGREIIKGRYSIGILRGHALMLISTYSSEHEAQEINSMIQTMNFNRWFLIDEDNTKRVYLDTSSLFISNESVSCWLMTDSAFINMSNHMLIKKPWDFKLIESRWHDSSGQEQAFTFNKPWQNEESNPNLAKRIKKCIQWIEGHSLVQ